MKLTLAMLEEWSACVDGVAWFKAQKRDTVRGVMNALIEEKHLDWANWLICHALLEMGRRRYALYAARKVEHIYAKAYQNDTRVKDCNDATEEYINAPTEANHKKMDAAGAAAWAAARDAARDAAGDAAWDAARDAWDAARAAWDAAGAAAWDAARVAAWDAALVDILRYGMKLLEQGEGK